jgi:hypothetical protein
MLALPLEILVAVAVWALLLSPVLLPFVLAVLGARALVRRRAARSRRRRYALLQITM